MSKEIVWHPCGDCAYYGDCTKNHKECEYSSKELKCPHCGVDLNNRGSVYRITTSCERFWIYDNKANFDSEELIDSDGYKCSKCEKDISEFIEGVEVTYG